jgi:hypothetical protein
LRDFASGLHAFARFFHQNLAAKNPQLPIAKQLASTQASHPITTTFYFPAPAQNFKPLARSLP